MMFVSMQIYEFLSKSQLFTLKLANTPDVCLYANIRIFKQITTEMKYGSRCVRMFVSMQIYEFLSKSQHIIIYQRCGDRCLSLCKYTNF